MPYKSEEEQKAYNREYYLKNRSKALTKAKERYSPEAKAKYDLEHRSQALERFKKYRRTLKETNPSLYMWKCVKGRAATKGMDFTISPEDIVIPDYCPVLGLKLEFAAGHAKDNSPSLDRIDTSLGYVKGNIHVISFKANTMKNTATLDELRALVSYLESIT